MTIFTYLFISFIIAGLMARFLYLTYLLMSWEEVCALYVVTNGEGTLHLSKYIETWPLHSMMFNIHIWDFSIFIVDQESMNKILDFFLKKSNV